jgi:hypothetical protein
MNVKDTFMISNEIFLFHTLFSFMNGRTYMVRLFAFSYKEETVFP